MLLDNFNKCFGSFQNNIIFAKNLERHIMETVDYGNPFHQHEHELLCLECGQPSYLEFCSETCFEASLL